MFLVVGWYPTYPGNNGHVLPVVCYISNSWRGGFYNNCGGWCNIFHSRVVSTKIVAGEIPASGSAVGYFWHTWHTHANKRGVTTRRGWYREPRQLAQHCDTLSGSSRRVCQQTTVSWQPDSSGPQPRVLPIHPWWWAALPARCSRRFPILGAMPKYIPWYIGTTLKLALSLSCRSPLWGWCASFCCGVHYYYVFAQDEKIILPLLLLRALLPRRVIPLVGMCTRRSWAPHSIRKAQHITRHNSWKKFDRATREAVTSFCMR